MASDSSMHVTRWGTSRHFAAQEKRFLDGRLVVKLLGDGGHPVGHSFGGVVAICAAAERPEAVRSMTLIEPALPQLAIADPAVRAFFKRHMEICQSGKIPAEIQAEFSKAAGIPGSIRGGHADPGEAARVGQSLLTVHFPSNEQQLAPDEFNDVLDQFMQNAERAR